MQSISISSLKIISKNFNFVKFTFLTKELAESDLPADPFTENYIPISENTPVGYKPTLNLVYILLEENKLYFWWKEKNKLVSFSEMSGNAVRSDHEVNFNGTNTTLAFPTDSGLMSFGSKFWTVGYTLNRDGFPPSNTGFTTLLQSNQCRFILEHTNQGLYVSSKASGYHAGVNTWIQHPSSIPTLLLFYWNPTTRKLITKMKYGSTVLTYPMTVSDSVFGAGENNAFLNIGKMENDPMNAWSSVNSKYTHLWGSVNNLIVKIGTDEASGHLDVFKIEDYFTLSQPVDQDGQPLDATFMKTQSFYDELSDFVSFDKFTEADGIITIQSEKGFLGDGILKNGTITPTLSV